MHGARRGGVSGKDRSHAHCKIKIIIFVITIIIIITITIIITIIIIIIIIITIIIIIIIIIINTKPKEIAQKPMCCSRYLRRRSCRHCEACLGISELGGRLSRTII